MSTLPIGSFIDELAELQARERRQVKKPGVPESWPPRQPLPSPLAVPSLPPELLPELLRDWLLDVATRMCIPLEFVAVPALVVAGSLVGRSVGIRPEGISDPWTVVPNLWGGIVAPPGMLKTPAIREASAPLRPLESAAREAYDRDRAKAEVDKAALNAELAQLKRAKGIIDRQAIGQVTRRLQECEATEKRYSTQDATPEKLGELLASNPRGILLLRDEIAGWLETFERPGREGERAFYLEAWAGTGSFTCDRIGRGTVYVPALCVSVLGSIQTGKLQPYIAEALGGSGGADGLLQRFQLLVWPDALPPWRRQDHEPNPAARERAFAAVRALDELDPVRLGATLPGVGGVPYLAFDREAQALFDVWRDELEVRLRSEELQRTPAFCAHLAKYRSLMPQLALLTHLLEGATGPVPLPAARCAAAWCEYLETHARKLYRRELAAGVECARLLAERIEAGDVHGGEAVRDLYRRGWRGLKTPDAMWEAVTTLERLGWVRVTEGVKATGRPAYIVHLHQDFAGDDG